MQSSSLAAAWPAAALRSLCAKRASGGRSPSSPRNRVFPFGRPPLSKTYLRSEEDLTGWYVRPASWYEQQDVDLLSDSGAALIDAAAHSVRLSSGQELGYQKILIATGGSNRRLDVPGADLPGVHYLRTVAECEAIKAE